MSNVLTLEMVFAKLNEKLLRIDGEIGKNHAILVDHF